MIGNRRASPLLRVWGRFVLLLAVGTGRLRYPRWCRVSFGRTLAASPVSLSRLSSNQALQTSGAELPILVDSLHEGSSVRLTQPSIGEVPTAALESCRLVPRWSSLQVPSRDIRASGHASRRVHKTTFPQLTADRRVTTLEFYEKVLDDSKARSPQSVATMLLPRHGSAWMWICSSSFRAACPSPRA